MHFFSTLSRILCFALLFGNICGVEHSSPVVELVKNKKKHKKVASSQKILEEFLHWQDELKEKLASDSPPNWMLKQIYEDLAFFIEHEMASKEEVLYAVQQSGNPYFLFCEIKNGSPGFYRYETEEAPIARIRASVMCQFFSGLAALTRIPDCYFVYDLGDGIGDLRICAPVFGPAKDRLHQNKAVLMPNFELADSNMIQRLALEVDRGNAAYPWKEKKSCAFWRGSTTGGAATFDYFLTAPRSQAVILSLKQPHLIDAKFHSLVGCLDPEAIQRSFSNYFDRFASIKTHLKYKYQLLIDGNTTSWSRAYWQLCSNCVILKQVTHNIEWFYPILIPYVHFIPIQEDLSDLEEKLLWAQAHDFQVRQISVQANAFAKEHLCPSAIYYYTYLVLKEYAALQNHNKDNCL